MSIEAVEQRVSALVDRVRADPAAANDPAILARVGLAHQRLSAAQALARQLPGEGGLVAAELLRDVLRDFPDAGAPPPPITQTDAAYREIGARSLETGEIG